MTLALWLGACRDCHVGYTWPRIGPEWPWPTSCPRCGARLIRLLPDQWVGPRAPLTERPTYTPPPPEAPRVIDPRGQVVRPSVQRLLVPLAAGPMTTPALAERLGLSSQAAHDVARQAMRDGLIRRVGKEGGAILWGLK